MTKQRACVIGLALVALPAAGCAEEEVGIDGLLVQEPGEPGLGLLDTLLHFEAPPSDAPLRIRADGQYLVYQDAGVLEYFVIGFGGNWGSGGAYGLLGVGLPPGDYVFDYVDEDERVVLATESISLWPDPGQGAYRSQLFFWSDADGTLRHHAIDTEPDGDPTTLQYGFHNATPDVAILEECVAESDCVEVGTLAPGASIEATLPMEDGRRAVMRTDEAASSVRGEDDWDATGLPESQGGVIFVTPDGQVRSVTNEG